MRDFIGPVLGAIVFVAVATAIILCFCIVLDTLTPTGAIRTRGGWVISSRYRRLALAMAISYVIGVAAAIGLMILQRL